MAGDPPSKRCCLATAEVGAHGAVLSRRRAVEAEELDASRHALDRGSERGWVLYRDNRRTCFLSKAGVEVVGNWVEEGQYPSGETISPEMMAQLRPRFGGDHYGLFRESYVTEP